MTPQANTPQDGGDAELFRLASLIGCEPEDEERHRQKLLAYVQARERGAEKRADTRWKREHDYWKQLAETFLRRDQLRPPEPMYMCDNPVCSSLHTAEQLQQLAKPQAGDGDITLPGTIDDYPHGPIYVARSGEAI